MADNPAVGATAGHSALVEVKDVTHHFQRDGHDLVVLRGVSLAITAGERLGESLPSNAVNTSWKSPVEIPRR